MLTATERPEDFREVTDKEKATIEAADEAWVRPPQSFIDKWISAGLINGVQYSSYKEDSDKPFILNGIPHTYQEALETYHKTAVNYDGNIDQIFYGFNRLKTNFPIPFSRVSNKSAKDICFGCTNLQVFVWCAGNGYNSPTQMNNAFRGCVNLEEIKGIIGSTYANYSYWVDTFRNCKKLREIRIKVATGSLSFEWSPLLSYESLRYLVDNPSKTGGTTITVHPDIYAKLTDETNTEWHQVLIDAAAKNIQFATTTT